MVKALAQSEIEQRLKELADWGLKDGKLHREYQFKDFVTAFSFMTGAALLAESRNHHPEWFNVYGKLRIDLTTHDANGITTKDFGLAKGFEALAQRLL